jgi:putative ABC transport system permease protein
MIKSVQRLQQTDPGFETKNLLTMQISLPRAKYKELRQQADFFQHLLDRLKQTPGMEQSAIITLLPLTGNDFNNGFYIDGRPLPRGESHLAYLRLISPNYFDVLGLPLLKGRQFTEQDSDKAAPVVIVNEALARKFFPVEEPIGKRLVIEYSHGDDPPAAREIVGIVRDIRESSLDAEPEPQTYLPFQQEPNNFMSLVVRTRHDTAAGAAAVQREVRALDQDVPVHLVRRMEQVVAESVAPRRFSMFLLGGFAAIALVLALVGIYGVMSYSVAQRTHEIGIRMALGAQGSDVLKMVVGQGMVIALFGVGFGLIGAFALTRLMSSLLYEVSATDPVTFIGIAVLLSAVALLASYIPARRAMKVDPMVALRYE